MKKILFILALIAIIFHYQNKSKSMLPGVKLSYFPQMVLSKIETAKETKVDKVSIVDKNEIELKEKKNLLQDYDIASKKLDKSIAALKEITSELNSYLTAGSAPESLEFEYEKVKKNALAAYKNYQEAYSTYLSKEIE